MSALRVLVADDEPIARRGLCKLLRAMDDVEVVGEAGDGGQALAAIRALRPDVVILDVQMPELDGVAVMRALPADELPGVVFVTAYDRYALAAFDVHAVDYVLKPVSPERFRMALTRARRRLAAEHHEQLAARLSRALEDYEGSRRQPDRFLVRAGTRSYFVRLSDVDWLEAADNYVRVHAAGRRHVIRETMKHLEQWLPRAFVRVHRSAIVNLDRIAELRPRDGGDWTVILAGGESVTLSRGYRPAFEARVGRPI